MDHDADVGVATAVTEIPGTAAVADCVLQLPGSSHNQVGRVTSFVPAGFDTIFGLGRRSCERAR
jgi:hypothetical protein